MHKLSNANRRQLRTANHDSSNVKGENARTNTKLQTTELLKDPQLVIAGIMTVKDEPCNIAQLNLKQASGVYINEYN
jgi:hypothetical protein